MLLKKVKFVLKRFWTMLHDLKSLGYKSYVKFVGCFIAIETLVIILFILKELI